MCVYIKAMFERQKIKENNRFRFRVRSNTKEPLRVNVPLGPVYTKRQRQCCDNSVMTLVILFSLKSVESLENRLQTQSGVSLQSCTTTLHFIWSDIADASLTLGVNGPLDNTKIARSNYATLMPTRGYVNQATQAVDVMLTVSI